MEKGDAASLRSASTPWWIEGGAGFLRTKYGLLQIGDAQADVMEARTPPIQKSGNRRVIARRLEELHPTTSTSEECDPHAFRRNLLAPRRVLSQQRRVQGYRGFQGVDRDSEVVDFGHASWLGCGDRRSAGGNERYHQRPS